MTTRTEQELASVAVNAANALQDERRHYEIACQEIASLRARVEALLVERHETNEALDEAVTAIRAKDQRIAELEKGAAVEYGIRVPGATWPEDGVLRDGNTFNRPEQVERLARYRDCWPGAELVARRVTYGDWETAPAEGGGR